MGMSRFRSSVPAVRGRIDTRPQSDPAVAAGMRNIHRDTDGAVLSGTTAEGQRINAGGRTLLGSPIRPSRLDGGVKTPMLDAMPKPAPTNLAGRQSLFRDMQTVGRGGVTPEMRARAAALGVDSAGFQRGMNKLADAPASIARPSSQFRTAPAGVAPRAVAQQPLQGADKARADMAKYGTTGAAERFLAANPAKDAEARMAKRNAAAATAKAELDAVDPRYNAPTLAKSADASVPKSKFRSYLASKGVMR
jgi:hypothetical protein